METTTAPTAFPAYVVRNEHALRVTATPVRGGYQVEAGGRTWFTPGVFATAAEAELTWAAYSQAYDL